MAGKNKLYQVLPRGFPVVWFGMVGSSFLCHGIWGSLWRAIPSWGPGLGVYALAA